MSIDINLPLSLYIHIPWCIKKCPYCDFNSHKKDSSKNDYSETKYIDELISDLTQKLPLIWGRKIKSIFIGGGTPSLFSPDSYEKLFSQIRNLLPFDSNIEITLEANPGAVEHGNFAGYKEAGINRISLGVQSFSDLQLKKLGRVHLVDDVYRAVSEIKSAKMNSFNLDIMYGLPSQGVAESIEDLKSAISLGPDHLSWYQLTIEPNTVFYRKKPVLPKDIDIITMEKLGRDLLAENNFVRYEISAYSKPGFECKHNINYWSFGDYLGIGAGAHGKLTDANLGVIRRYRQYKMPGAYMNAEDKTVEYSELTIDDIIFEYFLNRFRLNKDIDIRDFYLAIGLVGDLSDNLYKELLDQKLKIATDKGFINFNGYKISKTRLGQDFLDDLISIFLVDSK